MIERRRRRKIIVQYLEIRQIYGREINKTKKNKLGKRQKKQKDGIIRGKTSE